MKPPERVLLPDMDDALMGTLWPSRDRPYAPVSRETFARLLHVTAAWGIEIIPLTNRPPAQLAIAASILGSPLCLTESGASAWLPSENRYRLNERYASYAADVRPEVMRRIQARLPLTATGTYFEEAGNKQVLICVVVSDTATEADGPSVAELADAIREDLADLPVTVAAGGGIDVSPRGFNKIAALEWLPQLYPEFHAGAELCWESILYVDDAVPEEVARYVLERGGMVGCPANAKAATHCVMEQVGGWIAEAPFETGVLELVERWCA